MDTGGRRAFAGVVSAAAILGVAEVVAAVVDPASAPLDAVGSAVVDRTPDAVREWAIGTFGSNDKFVLFAIMAIAAVVVAVSAGLLERARRPGGSLLFAAFAVFAIAAALTRPDASWTWALPTLLGVAAGMGLLRLLIRRIDLIRSDDVTAADDRRAFLKAMFGVGVLAVVTGVAGRVLGARARDVSENRAAVRLPTPATRPPPIPGGADLRVPGLTRYVTANRDFYRVDTALSVPQVSTDDWSLRIHGMVEREIRSSFTDLARRPAIERTVTLTCVSNPVGGDLVGNSTWIGYPLADLIAEANPHRDADMVLSRSIDGFTAGTPLDAVTDGRDAMLAIGMNGEPLPVIHGFPARLVVPGLYGYVSATKWVTEIELTRFDRAQAYWTRRGWSARGPIKTGTRIDTPRSDSAVSAGRVTVAGVAWAQHRGIDAVHVQIDDGEWRPARLSQQYSKDTWRQWIYDWPATSGTHVVRARATDGTGAVQVATRADVVPDGATGYPEVTLHVS